MGEEERAHDCYSFTWADSSTLVARNLHDCYVGGDIISNGLWMAWSKSSPAIPFTRERLIVPAAREGGGGVQ